MRISTKCSIAIHILVLLCVCPEKKLTSENLARSVGSNSVIIRNILSGLKKAGLVDVKRGIGGASLCIDPNSITIWTVFEAVEATPLEQLMGLHPTPSHECPVGNSIYTLLEKPYGIVADSVKEAMQSYTLQQLLDEYYSIKKS